MGLNITKLKQNIWRLDIRLWNGGNELRKREVFYGNLAQAQERYFALKRELKDHNPRVRGSNPWPATKKTGFTAEFAQCAEEVRTLNALSYPLSL